MLSFLPWTLCTENMSPAGENVPKSWVISYYTEKQPVICYVRMWVCGSLRLMWLSTTQITLTWLFLLGVGPVNPILNVSLHLWFSLQ